MIFKHLSPGNAKRLFYEEVPWYIKLFQIFIKGDALVLVPFFIVVVAVGFVVSWEYASLTLAVFYAVRQLGEMIFWLLQQFGDHVYRPYDFGLEKLITHSIYILYQVHACVQVVLGIVVSIYIYTEYILR